MLKIMLVSLGCDKNTADSSKMLGILSHRGYELTSDIEEAEKKRLRKEKKDNKKSSNNKNVE